MTELPELPRFSLAGKTALVVGGSSGIGFGAAVALADAGAHVTLAARHREKTERAAERLTGQGWQAGTMSLDVTDTANIDRKVARAGPFDILVNSAGIARHARADKTTPDDFDAVMATNLRGAFFVTQAVARGLIDAKRAGSLINISSQMGQVGGADRAVYCASKFAVEGFSKAMAIDWGPLGIRVNTICPTFVRTPLTRDSLADKDVHAWIMGKVKLGRIGEVSDIMGAVVYLASDASGLVTGSSMMIDGGWTSG